MQSSTTLLDENKVFLNMDRNAHSLLQSLLPETKRMKTKKKRITISVVLTLARTLVVYLSTQIEEARTSLELRSLPKQHSQRKRDQRSNLDI